MLSSETEVVGRCWHAVSEGLGELRTHLAKDTILSKIQICFYILTSLKVSCGGGRWCCGKTWVWSLTDSSLNLCFWTDWLYRFGQIIYSFPAGFLHLQNDINDKAHQIVRIKWVWVYQCPAEGCHGNPRSPAFCPGAHGAVAGGEGGWVTGQLMPPFYWFSILVFCGQFCLPVVLFPTVHKKTLKVFMFGEV